MRPWRSERETIPRVDRIVGPGNAYVAAAKKLLAGEVGIDFVAGPTEILILTSNGDPKVIAADMLAQAEHDTVATAGLVTTSEELANKVATEIEAQLASLPTARVARQSIDDCGFIFIVPNMDVGVKLSNLFAPEHLSLYDSSLLPKIQNAGTVFLGPDRRNRRVITRPVPAMCCLRAAHPGCGAGFRPRIL